jgi:hypothetical protein
MKKYFLFSLIVLSAIFAVPIYAETVVNSGFIPGQIWYSKATLVEGDTVNIHTAVWNGEKNPLSAKIEFYDKNVILGSRDVVLAASELKDVSVPWKITAGDHVISAKIISSLATVSGVKEKIVLDRTATSDDRQFVSVIIKNNPVEKFSGDNALLQNQMDKTNSEINSIVPEKVSTSVTNGFNIVDDFRDKTFTQVTAVKNDTQKKINEINNEDKTKIEVSDEKVSLPDATEKPIAYIKLFLFSLLAFVLGSKIIFYGLSIIVVFLIIRFIYRKIRNR